jgi:carboxyl-terminal processing protease
MKKFSQDNIAEYRRSILVGAAAGLLLAVAFTAGLLARDLFLGDTGRVQASDTDGYPLLDEVQALIDRVYLREQPEYGLRQYGAIRGMLDTLGDNNTFFIEPPVTRSEADTLAGTYGGIGVLLRRNEKSEFVLYPYPDSPAAAAGISNGDRLLMINAVEVLLSDQQDAIDQQMRGEVKPGSGVEITVLKPDAKQLTVFIEFAVINVPSVVWRILPEDERIGYIQILRFTSRTPEELTTAISDLQTQFIEALVLDLRNNTGGLLDESVETAGLFLDGGVVTYEISQKGEKVFEAPAGGLGSTLPLAILVNQNTASASELVAGALRDRGRAILIGQKTYGKGTVQQIFVLSDGSSIHVTSAEWFTPNRTPLDGTGLIPDIEMIPDENGRDIETGEALRYLNGLLSQHESNE